MKATGVGNFLGDDPPSCPHGVMAGPCQPCIDAEKQKSGYLGAVRAKMTCDSIERREHGGGFTTIKTHFACVYSNTGENADYSKATPSGACWMQIDAETRAATFFKPGKRYYVTFTEAPD